MHCQHGRIIRLISLLPEYYLLDSLSCTKSTGEIGIISDVLTIPYTVAARFILQAGYNLHLHLVRHLTNKTRSHL
jgi:hypothetical protein